MTSATGMASLPQVPHPGRQFRGLGAGEDVIVRAIPLGQLPVQDLPGARFTADDDDGRPRAGSQPFIRLGGSHS